MVHDFAEVEMPIWKRRKGFLADFDGGGVLNIVEPQCLIPSQRAK